MRNMEMYPANYDKTLVKSLQNCLFGHRLKPGQTKNEYMIEFLQVAFARKENLRTQKTYDCMFPVDDSFNEDILVYHPQNRMGMKRFVFMPKSKLDGKAKIDITAYDECIRELEKSVEGGNDIAKKNSIVIIQNLLAGFNAVNQNRAWFAQCLLPICQEAILPESLGVKSLRKLSFQLCDADIDYNFEFNKYTYMCRGGEIYYLHLLCAINQYPEYAPIIDRRLRKLVGSFPQFTYLCNFVQETWDNYIQVPFEEKEKRELSKRLGAIPVSFSKRNQYTLSELKEFLNSKSHPFEKMEILSTGIILQMLRMMYIAAATDTESNCWVIDVNCKEYKSLETKKAAILAFNHNEEVICKYLYRGLDELRSGLNISDEQKEIDGAANDSYRLFRKLGKAIGIIIPSTGPGMRFTLSEDVIKFLVLSIIPARKMDTLDDFIEHLYQHFGMVIAPEQYHREMEKGSVKRLSDVSFLEENKKAFAQKLKDCGFLRDLSDATAIVENPYESEGE